MNLNILGTIGQLIHGIIAMVCRFVAITAALAIAPAIFLVMPIYLLRQNPNGDYGWLGVVVFFAAPWSCAFYIPILRVFRARKEAHEHVLAAAVKNTIFMFGGLIASYLFEGLFIFVGMHFFPVLHGAVAHAVAFELLLVAAFVPIIPLLKRRNYSELAA